MSGKYSAIYKTAFLFGVAIYEIALHSQQR